MIADATTFERWLKEARKVRDLTQRELASRIGCSVRLIEKLERGERKPSLQIAELLADELGIPPEQHAEFLKFARGGYQINIPGSASANYAPWRTVAEYQRRIELPTFSSRFVGREHEVERLADLVRSHTARLVTVTGPPGIGKTRLAVQVAATLESSFPDGVQFISLEFVRDADWVLPEIAQALSLSGGPDTSLLGTIRDHLHGKRLLLILDNFEQVVGAGPAVTALIETCPRLSVIVTSRELLRLNTEHEFRVPPLALPARLGGRSARLAALLADGTNGGVGVPGREQERHEITDCAAVRLFVQRAERVAPGFTLTPQNAPTIAEICERLEGVPLALELAAARVKSLTPEAILERMDNKLALLTGGPRDLPSRLQALRNAIEGSYALLDDSEKSVLRSLSVFEGGFTLEAAEAVCYDFDSSGNYESENSDSGKVRSYGSRLQVLNALESLLSKSLLQEESEELGLQRFRMLEFIREYALERLREHGEEQELRLRHARFYTQMVEPAKPLLK